MNNLLIFLVLSAISSEGRLIQINRTKSEEQRTDKPNPSIRLTRDIDDSVFMGLSNEETAINDEFVRSHNKRAKEFTKYNVNGEPLQFKTTRRIPQSENTQMTKMVLPQIPIQNILEKKNKNILGKKPIPKFNEIDDDDFQLKVNKVLTPAIESGEHEDEDFNVDDYEFDVNHDEYSGRGKHLEPRLNYKSVYGKQKYEPKSEKKIISKPIISVKSPKRERSTDDQAHKNSNIEYYYGFTTPPKYTSTTVKVSSEIEYEDDDNKDFDSKKLSHRTLRHIVKFANRHTDKSSESLAKYLSILPLFPQKPSNFEKMMANAEHETTGTSGNVIQSSKRTTQGDYQTFLLG